MLKHLDIFSGIGGFALGLRMSGGVETVAFCEIDKFCQRVLKKHWPDVPIYDDVRTMNYVGTVDIITGGYPCQPFSTAGNRKGEEDDRHLWPAMFSLIQRYRPTWIICENVGGHISMGLDDVLTDLESALYATRAFVIPACAAGAPHRRDRVWIVGHTEKLQRDSYVNTSTDSRANQISKSRGTSSEDLFSYANRERCRTGQREESSSWTRISSEISMDDADSERRSQSNSISSDAKFDSWSIASHESNRSIKSNMGGDVDGLSSRMDEIRSAWHGDWERGIPRVIERVTGSSARLRALGNAVVPQIVAEIGKAIIAASKQQ